MAKTTVYTESVVTLNNQEANARLDEIKRKAAEVRQEMARIAQEKGIDSKEFKAAQKELVSLTKTEKDLTAETKKFQQIMNNLNGSSLNELQSAARKLNQQMRRLKPGTEEFIAASKNLKQVRTRMKEIEDQARATQKQFGGFFKKIGFAGIIAGGISLVKKFATDFINQTKLIGDEWSYRMQGLRDAYSKFIIDLSSGKGLGDMIRDMRDAYVEGKRFAAVMDEITQRKRGYELEAAKLDVEIERNKKKMKDTSLSDEERLAAAEEVMKAERKIADERKKIAIDEVKAQADHIKSLTGMTEEEILAMTEGMSANRQYIKEAERNLAKLARLEEQVADDYTAFRDADIDAYTPLLALRESEAQLEAFQAGLTETQKKWMHTVEGFRKGNDQLFDAYKEARKGMYNADADYERNTIRINSTKVKLEQDIEKERQEEREKAAEEARRRQEEAYRKETEDLKNHYTELRNEAKRAYAAGELSKEQYEAKLRELEEKSINDQIALGEKYRKSVVDLQSQLLDLSIKEKERLQKLTDDLSANTKDSLVRAVAAAQKELEALVGEEKKALEKAIAEAEEKLKKFKDDAEAAARKAEAEAKLDEYMDWWDDLVKKAEDARKKLDPVAAIKDEMAEELRTLNEMYDEGLLTKEQYEQRKLQITQEYAKKIMEAQMEPYKKGIEVTKKYLDQAGNFVSSLQEYHSANLDAQMQKELTAAGDNAEKREEIEQKYEEKKLALQKKYANVNMGIEIAKTIAAGALAVVQGFAELGPIGGAVMAALIAATTAAQVATIIAQRNAIMNSSVNSASSSSSGTGSRVATGYSEGGFTESAPNDYQEVGVVHANEWVAPAAMVRANPITFARLESVRRRGKYSSSAPGFADGGMASEEPAAAAEVSGVSQQLLQRINNALEGIEASLPLKAYMIQSEVNAENELASKIKSIAGRKSE